MAVNESRLSIIETDPDALFVLQVHLPCALSQGAGLPCSFPLRVALVIPFSAGPPSLAATLDSVASALAAFVSALPSAHPPLPSLSPPLPASLSRLHRIRWHIRNSEKIFIT